MPSVRVAQPPLCLDSYALPLVRLTPPYRCRAILHLALALLIVTLPSLCYSSLCCCFAQVRPVPPRQCTTLRHLALASRYHASLALYFASHSSRRLRHVVSALLTPCIPCRCPAHRARPSPSLAHLAPPLRRAPHLAMPLRREQCLSTPSQCYTLLLPRSTSS